MARVAITGSIAFDTLMQFPGKFQDHFLPDKLDRISVSFLVDTLRKERGGCAANIAYSLGLLGERPLLVGTVGSDFGEYRRVLEEAGVDTSGVRAYPEEYTSSFFANTDENGNQICSFYTGAMRFAGSLSLRAAAGAVDLAVVSPNDPGAMVKLASECREAGIPFIFDPGQQIIRLEGDVLKDSARGSKMLIVNEYELEMFKRKAGLTDADFNGLAETVVVTFGEKGSEIRTRGAAAAIPIAPPARVLDPTGVGDAYRAGLIMGMVHGLSWETAGRMGSLAAAYVLETRGAQRHSYTLEEFVKRYRSVFGKSGEVEGLLA
jgi:adenosine kinase